MNAELEHQKAISAKATEVANALNGGPPAKCHGRKAERWQLCWDAALMALGGDPAAYRGHERPWPDNPAFYDRQEQR